ncbi:MAG: GntR family transcriptional regulator [Desulfobacula sp.]|jgi:DNA-binding GntR family transcriptional regulator|uniref:GntR family transcriptional regulator n=1 Tax=Desulfobacula sp. TaxID=2593537 RepID=UPI001DABE3D2|nr:GntR family transcriptional regulator [Desulfobacula sp.]MBT3807145.1 GntR family transcriptional regulator [Desulfobacula sp.]MBT4027275.1 GntR family transcriptional regulator [Desulfobacula sp.]MBT4199908.1 GntR family transcriptional regulator [Desulfobacula sp.]MBT4507709.1 GntR family transcriptional regulator [Desulfobacula sp.]
MGKTAKIQKIPKQPLAVTAYETLVKKIICLEYQPSQHLEENQLVDDLGIGRTPIREALVRLHSEKMVETHPKRGVIVRPITLQNTKAMFESMRIMELGLVDIVIHKNCSIFIKKMKESNREVEKAIAFNDVFELVEANHDFHMNFAKCSQNEFFIRAVQDVRTEAKRLSYLSYGNVIDPQRPLESHYESVFLEHEQMIKCLVGKDEIRLKELIEKHILIFRQRIIVFMTS